MILLGHNGAGKSTLINYLLGFIKENHHPFITHFKEHIKPLDRASLGYAPESATLDPNLNAFDYLKLMATLKGVKNLNEKEILQKVSLDVPKSISIKGYSKGMKQKLLLACALVGNPKTLVLDEPTSGLDPFVTKEIEELLISLKKEHEFIISTHSLRLAVALQKEIWILKEGKIVFKGFVGSEDELREKLLEFRPTKVV